MQVLVEHRAPSLFGTHTVTQSTSFGSCATQDVWKWSCISCARNERSAASDTPTAGVAPAWLDHGALRHFAK